MAFVSSRPERKLDEIVTPRAAMMTARMSSNGNRRSACPSALQVMNPRSRPKTAPC
jgi:hypothetical protein